jgi:uncharacterized protein with GYD domain
MPIYITICENTQKGAETIKEAPQRLAAGAQAIKKGGGRIIGAYATLGQYDYFFITEFPDNKASWPVLIQTATLGMTSAETMEAIPIEEFVQIVARV